MERWKDGPFFNLRFLNIPNTIIFLPFDSVNVPTIPFLYPLIIHVVVFPNHTVTHTIYLLSQVGVESISPSSSASSSDPTPMSSDSSGPTTDDSLRLSEVFSESLQEKHLTY